MEICYVVYCSVVKICFQIQCTYGKISVLLFYRTVCCTDTLQRSVVCNDIMKILPILDIIVQNSLTRGMCNKYYWNSAAHIKVVGKHKIVIGIVKRYV